MLVTSSVIVEGSQKEGRRATVETDLCELSVAYRARYRHAPPTTQPEHPIGDGAVKRAFPV